MLACKKEPATNVAKTCTLKSISKTENGAEAGKFYYTFDEKGRPIQIDFKVEKLETYVYSYETNKVILTDANDGRNFMKYDLDTEGRISSWRFEKLHYNDQGYLTEINKSHTWYSKLYYTNGNLTKFEDVILDWTGNPNTVTTIFEYNSEFSQEITGIGSPLSEIYYFESALIPLMGKASVNRIVKKTVSANGMPDVVTNYTYKEDDQGNIIQFTATQPRSKITVYTIGYQCQ
jgi:hypothetical protein